jgi:hypothetical protein
LIHPINQATSAMEKALNAVKNHAFEKSDNL